MLILPNRPPSWPARWRTAFRPQPAEIKGCHVSGLKGCGFDTPSSEKGAKHSFNRMRQAPRPKVRSFPHLCRVEEFASAHSRGMVSTGLKDIAGPFACGSDSKGGACTIDTKKCLGAGGVTDRTVLLRSLRETLKADRQNITRPPAGWGGGGGEVSL